MRSILISMCVFVGAVFFTGTEAFSKTLICYGANHYTLVPRDLDCDDLGSGDCGCITYCESGLSVAPGPIGGLKQKNRITKISVGVLNSVSAQDYAEVSQLLDDIGGILLPIIEFDRGLTQKVFTGDPGSSLTEINQFLTNAFSEMDNAVSAVAAIEVLLNEGSDAKQEDVDDLAAILQQVVLELTNAESVYSSMPSDPRFVLLQSQTAEGLLLSELDTESGQVVNLFTEAGETLTLGGVIQDLDADVTLQAAAAGGVLRADDAGNITMRSDINNSGGYCLMFSDWTPTSAGGGTPVLSLQSEIYDNASDQTYTQTLAGTMQADGSADYTLTLNQAPAFTVIESYADDELVAQITTSGGDIGSGLAWPRWLEGREKRECRPFRSARHRSVYDLENGDDGLGELWIGFDDPTSSTSELVEYTLPDGQVVQTNLLRIMPVYQTSTLFEVSINELEVEGDYIEEIPLEGQMVYFSGVRNTAAGADEVFAIANEVLEVLSVNSGFAGQECSSCPAEGYYIEFDGFGAKLPNTEDRLLISYNGVVNDSDPHTIGALAFNEASGGIELRAAIAPQIGLIDRIELYSGGTPVADHAVLSPLVALLENLPERVLTYLGSHDLTTIEISWEDDQNIEIDGNSYLANQLVLSWDSAPEFESAEIREALIDVQGRESYRVKEIEDILLAPAVSSLNNSTVARIDARIERVYPTPAAAQLGVDVLWNESSPMQSVELLDAAGRALSLPTPQLCASGEICRLEFDVSSLSAGAYTLIIRSANGSVAHPVLLTR